MTEQELMDLDFEKVMVYDEESDNGYDYYYFRKRLGGGIIMVGDTTLSGKLHVTVDDVTALEVKDINLVKELINVFSKIKNAGREASLSKENG